MQSSCNDVDVLACTQSSLPGSSDGLNIPVYADHWKTGYPQGGVILEVSQSYTSKIVCRHVQRERAGRSFAQWCFKSRVKVTGRRKMKLQKESAVSMMEGVTARMAS